MELRADEAALLRDGDDALRACGHRRRLRGVGVCEVERLAARLDRRPADARYATVTDANGAPAHDSQPVDAAVLLRPLEGELEPEADPEGRSALLYPFSQRRVQTPFAEPVHRARGRADSREHREVCGAHCARILGDLGHHTEAIERDDDRADVSGAVRADRDVHTTPFVDGTPVLSTLTAPRRARPTAL